MKIVYCIPSLHNSGGMERVLSQKANWLAENTSNEIFIITSSQGNRPDFFPLSKKINKIELEINYDLIKDFSLLKRIIKRIKAKKIHRKKITLLLSELEPDITISLFTHEMLFLPYIKEGGKKILEFHFSKAVKNFDSLYNKENLFIRAIRKLLDKKEHKAIKKYDKFVVLTQRDAKDWGKNYNPTVIANPIDVKTDELADTSIKKVLAVGRLSAQKGFDILINIWASIPEEDRKGWRLDIFGEGSDKDLLLSLIRNLNLKDSIKIHNSKKNIQEVYLNHSILCFPSRYEGFGLVLAEGMAHGLPAISFDCPCGPSEIIHNEESGFLIKENDIEEFKRRLFELIKNEELRQRMGKKAAENVRERFSIEQIMMKWIELFNNP